MNYIFQHITPSVAQWEQIEAAQQSSVFQTRQWCNYMSTIGYSPYVVEVQSNQQTIAYFVGERIWRGVWLLTAPFEGIGTYTQGLAMLCPITEKQRVEIYEQLAKWVFDNHVASYLQVDDWYLRRDSAEWIPYANFKHNTLEKMAIRYEFRPTLYLDMAGKSEEELWSMQHYKSCKYSVNKARKLGLKVHQITKKKDFDRFLDVHYSQLHEVCESKGMKPKPSQSRARMQALADALFPDRIIMLECIGPDENGVEQVMSTGMFCADKGESIYWTGASYQRYQKYCPNELMVWEAIRLLQQRGAGGLNFGGMANYKLKFGTIYAYVPRLIFTKYEWVYRAKTMAKDTYHGVRNTIAMIVGKRSFK